MPTRLSASSPPNHGAGVVGPCLDFIAQQQDQSVGTGEVSPPIVGPTSNRWLPKKILTGDTFPPTSKQGLLILGHPCITMILLKSSSAGRREKHDVLLQRTPAVPHLQAAWLLLTFCAARGHGCGPTFNLVLPSATEVAAACRSGPALHCSSPMTLGCVVSTGWHDYDQISRLCSLRTQGWGTEVRFQSPASAPVAQPQLRTQQQQFFMAGRSQTPRKNTPGLRAEGRWPWNRSRVALLAGRGWSDKRLVQVAFVGSPSLLSFFPSVFNKCHADT